MQFFSFIWLASIDYMNIYEVEPYMVNYEECCAQELIIDYHYEQPKKNAQNHRD